jgi:hypothetical protein
MASASIALRRRALRTPPRATRAKPAFSYAESSGDSDHEEYADSEDDNVAPAPAPSARPSRRTHRNDSTPRGRPRPTSSRTRTRAYHPDDSEEHRTPKRRKTWKPASPKPLSNAPVIEIDTSGVIPPWQTLPYHVFVQIFQYATYPLYDEHTFQPLPSGKWLLNVARLCKAFAEPAFTVLYSSPPLVPMVQAHRLVELLKADPIPLAFKYRQKVESLRIDVGQVAAYSLGGGWGHLDLYGLIKDLSRLVDLEFYHQKDMAPYRTLDDTIKWTYPESIFEALEYIDPEADANRGDKTSICRLRSWRWSSRMGGKKWPLEMMPTIHLKPSFASLRKLSFVNYQIPFLKKDEEDPKHEHMLAKAVKALPNLEHLIFESSTLVNAKLLPLLPTSLRNLELINCWEVIADDFAAFLLTHGSQLRCLTLNHNQSLNLSFLTVLGSACPKLQVLRMNLTYYNLHATYRDSDPQYDQLLLPGQVPVWPSTLQILELSQLRKWETEASEMFFQSLLDSAGNLPDLRRLTIQTSINIAWRDRATFRDKWVGSLTRVFKRVSAPPETHSTIHPDQPKPIVLMPVEKVEPSKEEKEAIAAKRSSLRLSAGSRPSSSSSSSSTLSSTHSIEEKKEKPSPARRSTRTATRNLQSGKYAESSDDSDKDVDEEAQPEISARDAVRQARMQRELGILKQTAGLDLPAQITSPPQTASDSDDEPLVGNTKGKGKQREVIQGMCEVVEVRIDNLRPTETQVTEADFLDDERSGDSDWNGEDEEVEGYAW